MKKENGESQRSKFNALRLLPKIRMFSKRKAFFLIIPIGWVWMQVFAGAVFLGGFLFAGLEFNGAKLDDRAKEAVANYFKTQQGGKTEEQLKQQLAEIENAHKYLSGPGGPLAKLLTLEKTTDFLLKTAEAPTAASQGIFPDHVVVRWTRPRVLNSGSLSSDYRYAVYRKKPGDKANYGEELGQVPGDQAAFIDLSAQPGVSYIYRVYRYPSNPAGKPEGQTDHVWLTTGEWVEGWAGEHAGPAH